MNKELLELRSKTSGADSPAVPRQQSSAAVSDSPANVDQVDAKDDFNIRASTISLEDIHLGTEVAVEAFKIFANIFRPQLPIIGSISVDAMLHGQPLLFWTVIIIIGSHRPEARFVDVNMRFKDAFTRYLNQQIMDAPLPLYKIQAIVLLRVRIQLVVAKFSALLNRDTEESTTASLIRLVDAELSALKPQGTLHDDKETRIELDILDAKLHIYALFFAKASEGTSRHIMLATALSAAQRFIHLATLSWRSTAGGLFNAAAAQRERCLPKNHYRGFAFATIILLKFFYRQQDVAPEERQGAARHIALAQDHFRGCSIDPEDEYSRTAKVFQVLAQNSTGETGDSKLRLTHRMGASIVYDAVTNASEVRGAEVNIQEEKILEPVSNEMQATTALHDWQALDLTQMAPSHFGMNLDLLDGFWNDPFMSMVNFDTSDMHTFLS
ncbi:uncharacterized protein J7T54_004717 [Emericellopsis cladophorae]|uniref:Transcription factor domain-containing protein n=1 Tax=Emericellopsis cladophorae TaxID=2686198 RepID=A0A9P9Y676_9HYPO|nr:uncharacterized protein J7T54_004717 [Emericellopsis cladophorae]KAI6784171.1 hypothetical protein J7T54_004717 [Emericellopsis cladophorae]